MKWLRTAAIAVAGFLLTVGLAMLGRSARRANAAEQSASSVVLDGSKRAQKQAEKANAKAEQAQSEAKAAADAGLKAMDKVGAEHESVANILDSWRADRLQ